MKHTLRRNFNIALFLLPTIIVFIIFYLYPLIQVLLTSFTEWSFLGKPVYNGIDNYIQLFYNNEDFKAAFINTLTWVLLSVFISVPFSIAVAFVLSRKAFGWKFTRNTFVLPNIISSAAIAMVFKNMLDPDYGIVNTIIKLFIKDFNIIWLAQNGPAFFAVTMSFLFYGGIGTLLVLAEISSIPEAMIESAKIDGATSVQIDLYILLPMLKNIIGTLTFLATVGSITAFDMQYLLTNGGPGNSTLSLSLLLFKTAILENNYGLGNTVGVLQLLLGLFAVFIVTKIFKIGKN